MNFRNKLIFYGEELLAPHKTPKLEDHPLSADRDCLFNIFAATLHIWRPSSLSATWGRAMSWWQETHTHMEFLILKWLYFVILNLKIEFPNTNTSFAWQCLNLWNPILINIKPELFTKWQVDRYIYFSSIFKNNMTLFFEYEYKTLLIVNYNICFALRRLKLWN
jgi:hypothetical protein